MAWSFGSAVLCTYADYVGLAVVQPSLPFYLADIVAADQVIFWNGVILSCQFIAIMFGNIIWGCIGDRLSSWQVLMLAMGGDTIFFFSTAFARSPATLVVVRFLAGLSTPLTPALLFILERAPSPMTALKGVGQYVLAINFAYLSGGVIVAAVWNLGGWVGVNLVAATIAACALGYTAFFSAPSLIVGKKPPPSGVWYALRSPPFAAHAAVSFSAGWAFNANILLPLWLLRDVFGWDAQKASVLYIVLPFLLISTEKAVRFGAARVGSNAIISTGMFMQLLTIAAAAVPAVHRNLVALVACVFFSFCNLVMQMLPNQSKPRQIADGYATNATGQVTGAGRVCFAVGQGAAPIVSALAYDAHPSLAYIAWGSVELLQLVVILASREPLFHDKTPKAPEGSEAARLKADAHTRDGFGESPTGTEVG